MNKTKIEYVDYTWNPIQGYCPNNCPYCYAHRMYNRFGWDKTIRFDEKILSSIHTLKEPSRIFIGSMIDMYHSEIPTRWVKEIIKITRNYPGHTFITLTKFPENLIKFNFPDNWWIGITLDEQYVSRRDSFRFVRHEGVKFISFEPLLAPMGNIDLREIDWVIIGGLTPRTKHRLFWIDNILNWTDYLNIPVFIKDNAHYPEARKNFPV